MANHLIDTVNRMLGTPLTKKENPVKEKTEVEKTLYGAAVPVALAGIYQLATRNEGADRLLNHLIHERAVIENPSNEGCVEFTFGDSAKDVVEKCAEYAGDTFEAAYSAINNAARHAYRTLIQELVSDRLRTEDITKYMVAQRHSILSHLPESLQLGHLLGDETLDDVSNKMEGPISNLMHNLGASFSGSPR